MKCKKCKKKESRGALYWYCDSVHIEDLCDECYDKRMERAFVAILTSIIFVIILFVWVITHMR